MSYISGGKSVVDGVAPASLCILSAGQDRYAVRFGRRLVCRSMSMELRGVHPHDR